MLLVMPHLVTLATDCHQTLPFCQRNTQFAFENVGLIKSGESQNWRKPYGKRWMPPTPENVLGLSRNAPLGTGRFSRTLTVQALRLVTHCRSGLDTEIRSNFVNDPKRCEKRTCYPLCRLETSFCKIN